MVGGGGTWFDVSVDDVEGVDVGKSTEDLTHYFGCLFVSEGLVDLLFLLNQVFLIGHERTQGTMDGDFHFDEDAAGHLPILVNFDNIFMFQTLE